MEWNDETIARIRALWSEGYSTAEIGRRMGISKNAVVGKAHRLMSAGPAVADPPRHRRETREHARHDPPSHRPDLAGTAIGATRRRTARAGRLSRPCRSHPWCFARFPRSRGPPAGSRPAAGRSANPARRISISVAIRPSRPSPTATNMPHSLT